MAIHMSIRLAWHSDGLDITIKLFNLEIDLNLIPRMLM